MPRRASRLDHDALDGVLCWREPPSMVPERVSSAAVPVSSVGAGIGWGDGVTLPPLRPNVEASSYASSGATMDVSQVLAELGAERPSAVATLPPPETSTGVELPLSQVETLELPALAPAVAPAAIPVFEIPSLMGFPRDGVLVADDPTLEPFPAGRAGALASSVAGQEPLEYTPLPVPRRRRWPAAVMLGSAVTLLVLLVVRPMVIDGLVDPAGQLRFAALAGSAGGIFGRSESPARQAAAAAAARADRKAARPSALVPAAAPPAAPPAPSSTAGWSERAPLRFAFDGVQPVDGDGTGLQKLATRLLTGCAGRIKVTGHTCSIGEPPTNWLIGLGRARTTVSLLTALGVPADRMHATSAGSYRPLATNTTRTGRELNRRVTVTCEPTGRAAQSRASGSLRTTPKEGT
jgi:outer membrane protein OmpA-like peptidoglycan-associated protein